MDYLALALALAVAVVVGLLAWRRALVVRRRAYRDREWMPSALGDAKLVWSEKTFRCEEPVPSSFGWTGSIGPAMGR